MAQQNKLWRLLSTFDQQDWKDCGNFLQSPHLNTSKNAKLLFITLRDQGIELLEPRRQGELIKIFAEDGSPRRSTWLRNIKSQLTKKVETYLAWQQLEIKEHLKHQLFKDALMKRELWPEWRMAVKNELRSSPSSNDLLQRFRRLTDAFNYYNHTPPEERKERHGRQLEQTLVQFTELYQEFSIQIAAILMSRTHFHQEDYRATLQAWQQRTISSDLVNTLQRLKKYSPETITPETLDTLTHAFFSIAHEVSDFSRNLLFTELYNLATPKANQGEVAFQQRLLRIFKMGEAADCFYVDGQMRSSIFLNGVMAFLFNEAFEDLNRFRYRHLPKVESHLQEDLNLLLNIYIPFFRKDYEEAHRQLTEAPNLKATFYRLRVNWMEVRILLAIYCLGDLTLEQTLRQRLDSFQHFVKQSGPQHSKASYLGAVKLMRKLIRLKSRDLQDSKQWKALEAEFTQSVIPSKNWFLMFLSEYMSEAENN